MRAQQEAVALLFLFLSGNEDGVLHVARRMVQRKVQRLEVVVVGFDLGPFGDRVAHRLEDADDLVGDKRDGMRGAEFALVCRGG